MAASEQQGDPGERKSDLFTATSWTVVAAAQGESAEAREALEKLCATYWYPLYAYARHRQHSPQDAEDLTQGFFYELLNNNLLRTADRRRGKFRAFLMAAFNGYRVNRYHAQNAIKRGGGRQILSLDIDSAEQRFSHEPASDLTPEKLFERNWARTVLEQVQVRLDQEYAGDKAGLYAQLKVFLSDPTAQRDYQEIARRLEMTPNAVAVAVHRLRQRYRKLLAEEVSNLVGSADEVEEEMRHLHSVLAEG